VLTCSGLLALLGDLCSGSLEPGELRESRRHLARCGSCAAYRRSYGETVALAREAYRGPEGVGPAEMPEALVEMVLAAARTRLSGFSPRARYLIHLLAGVAAGPLLAFCLR
jgi:anti-sigma factor RsiW